jgi:hypothetical protein
MYIDLYTHTHAYIPTYAYSPTHIHIYIRIPAHAWHMVGSQSHSLQASRVLNLNTHAKYQSYSNIVPIYIYTTCTYAAI